MAILWFGSLIPWTKSNGKPYVGATVTFYDAGTTTPQTTYTDSSLSSAAGLSDRTADSSGIFGAIFLSPGSYRCKVLDSAGSVIRDVDGISVPQTSDYVPPDAGETSEELLARTGDLKARYGTGAHSGWVRANARTIGSASSGATERANADCEDLFEYLWTADANLTVSTGRGASAAADWAANKTITLPDIRGKALIGLDDMGNSAAGVLTGLTTLGEVVGDEEYTLVAGDIPQITGTTSADGNHGHPARYSVGDNNQSSTSGGIMLNNSGQQNKVAFTGTLSNTVGEQIGASGTHTHTVTAGDASPDPISLVQPGMGVTMYIKL